MHIMFSSDRFLLVLQLLLLKLLGFVCLDEETSPRLSSHPSIRLSLVSASLDDYFTVLNCSTPKHVPHHKLDWYFQTRSSSHPPRVIWQRGRSNIHRYLAYSPDQLRHFLQIKPLHSNDSGTYMCLDQTTGFSARLELSIRELFVASVSKFDRLRRVSDDRRSCAATSVTFDRVKTFVLIAFALLLSQITTSESQVT